MEQSSAEITVTGGVTERTENAPGMEGGFLLPLYFPFLEKRWVLKLWWLPFLSIFPPLAVCLLRGWRVNIVRRMCNGDEELLPDIKDVPRFFIDGVILIVMTFLYAIVPTLIIIGFSLDGIGDFISDLKTIYAIGSLDEVLSFIFSEIVENGLVAFIKYGWMFLAWPLYRVGFFRYCKNDNILSFFNIPANFLFLVCNIKLFLGLYFFLIVLLGIWWFLFVALLSTGVGVLILPFMVPFLYWSTAYAFGRLAMTVEL